MKTLFKNLPFWPTIFVLAALMALVVWQVPEGTWRFVGAGIVIALFALLIFGHAGTDKPNQPRT